MKMRAGGQSGGADIADNLPLFHARAFFQSSRIAVHMGIGRFIAIAVAASQDLLVIGKDYELTSLNPLTVSVIKGLQLGDTIITKLYDEDRDSAECPATPSTMGLYPLYSPAVVTDNTFKTPQSLLLGHDGSKTSLLGDIRDDILLEFETRVYNSAKAEFRTANSLPAYSGIDIRCGAFRNTGYSHGEFYDLIRHYFAAWTVNEKLDPIVNEFYDANDEWTWNYSNTEFSRIFFYNKFTLSL